MRAAGPLRGSLRRTKPIAASYLGSGYKFFRRLKKCVDTYGYRRQTSSHI